MTKEERFKKIVSEHIKRPGIDKLMEWLQASDFYSAPASTRFHGNYPGGLLEHSLNVYDELYRLIKVYPEIAADEESLAIISLFHDLCKVNFYASEKRNRKTADGKWEQYDAYTINEKFCFGGHGSKSLFIVQNFVSLTPEEAVAINCHMGFSDEAGKYVASAFERYPLAWLLSVADQSATFILERKD